MSKTIRVDEQLYDELEKLRDWKESYAQVIWRILKLWRVIYDVREVLGPSHYLLERPAEREKTATTSHR